MVMDSECPSSAMFFNTISEGVVKEEVEEEFDFGERLRCEQKQKQFLAAVSSACGLLLLFSLYSVANS